MSLPGRYNLKWHGHGVHLNLSISGLYRSDAFSDVILATTDGRYNAAHQFVLSACSPYLHNMFMVGSNTIRNSSKLVVVLPSEISHSTLSILLQYIYRGEVIVNHEQLPKIMKAAEILQIKSLCPGKIKQDLRSNGNNSVLKQQNKNNSDCYNLDLLKTKQSEVILDDKSDLELTNGSLNNSRVSKSSKSVKGLNNHSSNEYSTQVRKKIRSRVEPSFSNQKKDVEKSVGFNIVEKMIVGEEVQVKAEPLDWEEEKVIIDHDNIIKQEVIAEEEIIVETDNCYVPLTCDLCLETFSTPAMWVRHIEQNHPTTALASSGKRTSVEGNSEEYPPLHCELCQKVFNIPAEWVRHVQSHMEKQVSETAVTIGARGLDSALGGRGQKVSECNVCGKMFQTHASMQIHARTHTGERPFLCRLCGREFSVKSNYLRHLRTVHTNESKNSPNSSVEQIDE